MGISEKTTMLGRSAILAPKSVAQCANVYQQQRGMANLKAIAIRLKSVKNIQKITQSMKMVSAEVFTLAFAKPSGTNCLKSPASKTSELSVLETNLGLNWPGCSLRISFALALKSVVCLPNSETLPRLPAQL